MSDPFDPNATAGAPVGSVGAPTGFIDNFEATLGLVAQNDDYLSGEAEIRKSWDNSVRALEARNGARFQRADPLPIIENQLDPNADRSWTRAFLGVNDTSPERVAQFEEARKINDQLNQLNDPSAPSIDKIIQQVTQARKDRAQSAAEVTEASNWGTGLLGRFAGGLVGAVTDPAQLPFMLIPGGMGEGVVAKIGGEIASNAIGSAGVQAELINPQAKAFGEPEGSVAEAALTGAALGGVIGGARLGLGALATRALDRASFEIKPFDVNDAQLRSMFPHDSENPSIRAGAEALDQQGHFQASNSYSDTTTGIERFNAEAGDIYNSLTGTQRVLAQVLPRPDDFTFDNLDYHTQVVREQTPEVYDRLEAASGRVNELDAQIAETQQKLEGLTVVDAMEEHNRSYDAQVQALESRAVDGNISQRERDAAVRDLQTLKTLGTRIDYEQAVNLNEAHAQLINAPAQDQLGRAREFDRQVKLADDGNLETALERLQKPLEDNLVSLQAARRDAAKEFRFARNDMDQRIKQVQAEEKIKEFLKPQAGTATERSPFDVEALRGDRVEAARVAVDDAHEALVQGNYGEDLVRPVEEPKPNADGTPAEPVTTVPEGMVDLGGGLVLPKDFLVSDDALGSEISVGELFSRMQEDEKLVEAMRTCSL